MDGGTDRWKAEAWIAASIEDHFNIILHTICNVDEEISMLFTLLTDIFLSDQYTVYRKIIRRHSLAIAFAIGCIFPNFSI